MDSGEPVRSSQSLRTADRRRIPANCRCPDSGRVFSPWIFPRLQRLADVPGDGLLSRCCTIMRQWHRTCFYSVRRCFASPRVGCYFGNAALDWRESIPPACITRAPIYEKENRSYGMPTPTSHTNHSSRQSLWHGRPGPRICGSRPPAELEP